MTPTRANRATRYVQALLAVEGGDNLRIDVCLSEETYRLTRDEALGLAARLIEAARAPASRPVPDESAPTYGRQIIW